jgi:hypothetical protein
VGLNVVHLGTDSANVMRFAVRAPDGGDLEHTAWHAREGAFPPSDDRPLIESGIHRGPDYRVTLPSGADHVVKAGDWLVAFALQPATIAKKGAKKTKTPWVTGPVTHVPRTGSEPPTPAKAPSARKRDNIMDLGQAVEAMLAPVRKEIADAEAEGDYVRAKDLRRQMTICKMQVNERLREGDLSMLGRQVRGEGIPMLTNKRALPDDPDIRYE